MYRFRKLFKYKKASQKELQIYFKIQQITLHTQLSANILFKCDVRGQAVSKIVRFLKLSSSQNV